MMNQKFYAIRSPILCGCSVGLVWGKGEGVVVVKHFFFYDTSQGIDIISCLRLSANAYLP